MCIDVEQPFSTNLLLSNLLFVLTVVGAIDRLEILSGTKCLKGRTKPLPEHYLSVLIFQFSLINKRPIDTIHT